MGLLNILGGPITGLVKAVGGVIDSLTTTDKEKLDAKSKLLEIERTFNIALVAADAEFAKQQAEVIKSEVQSESWLARNWRPVLMLTFTYIIAHNYVIAPVFSVQSVPIPEPMWELLKLGMTGYIVGRSAEKMIPSLGEVLATKTK